MSDPELMAGFSSTCPVPSSGDPEEEASVASVLRAHWHAAREAWPALEWTPREFAAFLGARVRGEGSRAEAVGRLRGADLYLAGLCAAGDARALACFDAQILGGLSGALASVGAGASDVDEVRQQLRTYLFAADGSGAKIDAYSGRASLSRWVRVAAVRTFQKLRRQPTTVSEDLIAGFAEPGDQPDLEYFKQLYRIEFKQAFAEAIGTLAPRQRNLLKHAILDGLTADQIGRIYHVSKATAARQIAAARAALIESTRAGLRAKLDLSPSELRSVLRVIQSEVDLSIRRVLGSKG
jgi:RNA polymerase sigma-70 factor (ECF subfamily)